MVTVTGGRYWT